MKVSEDVFGYSEAIKSCLRIGLYFYLRIIEEAGKHLVSSGMLFFEIGYDQGQAVSELMRAQGYREVQVVQDYAGLDRVVLGTYCERN